MASWFKSALDFIYPPRCMACGAWSVLSDSLCSECIDGFERIEHPMCMVCGRPFETSPTDHQCGTCAQKLPPYDLLRSAAFYEGSLREAILKFKFSAKTSLTKTFGEMAVNVLDNEFAGLDIDSIIPVPLHPARLRWRGFNQALLISRHMGRRKDIWVDAHSLRRVRHTTPQVQLTPKQRTLNVRGAFAVARPRFVDGRKILLLDDVATTCATLRECAKVLRKAGAAKVYALTVARARP